MATETAGTSGERTGPLRRLRNRLEGPNTVGDSRAFWAAFVLAVVAFVAYPLLAGSYAASRFSLFLLYAIMGLSLALVWGYAGILSFGQVAFFGVAGYTFGVVSVNFTSPFGITVAVLAAVLAGAALAFALGYFMFYGGVRDVYVTIITLVATLVLHTFMAQTAGDEWTIGSAALGGFNGMPTIPDLALGGGPLVVRFDDLAFYYLVLGVLLVLYLGLRVVANSDYGRVMVAVREDEDRTEMFGYNVARLKLGVFTLGGALAGLSGVLYASWGNYISPGVFALTFAALPVVWVSVGGRKALIGAIAGTIAVRFVSNSLTGERALVIVGALLLVVILFLPDGVVPRLEAYALRLRRRSEHGTPTDTGRETTEAADR